MTLSLRGTSELAVAVYQQKFPVDLYVDSYFLCRRSVENRDVSGVVSYMHVQQAELAADCHALSLDSMKILMSGKLWMNEQL